MNLHGLPEEGNTLKVAYFAGTMRPGHDGVTRVLYRWIEGLEKAGIEHLFVSPIIPTPAESPTRMVKVPSVVFPLLREYRLALPGHGSFENALQSFGPDLIHINSPCPLGHAALKYGQKNRIPVVATYHTHFPSYARYYGVKALEMFSWSYFRKLYNGCDRVYVPSRPILEELRAQGLTTLELLPHGVDTGAFSPAFHDPEWKARLGIEGKRVLLYVGRLVWEKDLRVLSEMFGAIRSHRQDVAMVMVGDGPIRSELEKLMPGALFLGRQSGAALAAAYASSDVFVFPSTTETFGNVTIEAMASGLPPVCARKGGAAGLIAHGENGLLATPADVAEFVRETEFLLDHPAERAAMAEAALAYARRQSWEAVLERMFASYDDVIGNACARFAHTRRAA